MKSVERTMPLPDIFNEEYKNQIPAETIKQVLE